MNFITFSADATNIWPAANSTAGGQLVTEYNIKSRESVATNPEITYAVGPSYVHSDSDFEVKILEDAGGAIINAYTLSISEGRGVINGHFVETLTPMTIDLVEANVKLASQSKPQLKGALAIGIRTFFSTEQTMAGSILVENDEDMYLGIQMVVLPAEELITPMDSPDDQSKVTADIKLATFTFLNNSIRNIVNLSTKLEWLTPERIRNFQAVVDSKYITKYGLNPKKLYTFAGKGTDPETGLDTWEDSTDSMVVWDSEPVRTLTKPTYKQAQIIANQTSAYMVLPHKQVTGMVDDSGRDEYYAPRLMELPIADYVENTTGFVTKSYTKQIKTLATYVSQFRSFPQGKQIAFYDARAITDPLPAISPYWNIGDYILVKNDEYYLGEAADTMSAPATMYVILPGVVKTVQYVSSTDGDGEDTDPSIPDNIGGMELGFQEWSASTGAEPPETQYPEFYPAFWDEEEAPRGVPGNPETNEWEDYFRIRYFKADSETYEYTDYYYAVLTTGTRAWSDPMVITGSISLATEDIIGGFLNAPENAIDYGYVRLDDEGHLRLTDYSILRSGTLAYQIAADVSVTGETTAEIQSYLNEYVNDRVAFPSPTTHGTTISVLNIYLHLTEDMTGDIDIMGIDSRFNTAVCLHILGDATASVSVNIADCQQFMIHPTIEGSPIINIFRTNLYYDPVVFQYIKTCERDTSTYGTYTGFRDLKIWYEQIASEDPSLLVDGMTVSELDSPIITSDIDYWKELYTAANDNNYMVALRSITFSPTGDIVGCEILAANNSTDNVEPGDKIVVGDFVLPQGENLIYPVACLTKVLKVTGHFTCAYLSENTWYVTDNSFSLATGTFNSASGSGDTMSGTVAFHSVTTLVPSTIAQTSINVWETDSYHIFRGGAIG